MDREKRRKSTNINYLTIDIRKIKDFTNKSFYAIWTYKDAEISKMNMELKQDKLSYDFYFGQDFIKKYVAITYTKCNYGNYRKWFICPKCNNKKGVLYFDYGNHLFYCRNCLNINYLSSQMSKGNKITDINLRLEKIIKKLEFNDFENFDRPTCVKWEEHYFTLLKLKILKLSKIEKPKHMHNKTFDLLKGQINDLYFKIMYFDDYNNYNPHKKKVYSDRITLKEGLKSEFILKDI
jgi:hypothetical protein